MPVAILAMALGAFAIGLTEFAVMGLLPAELAVLRSPAVLLVLSAVAFGCGGLFALYSYIAPMMAEVAGFPRTVVPALLAVFGLGMTIGTVLGGRLADHVDGRRAVVGLLAAQAVLLLAAVPAVRSPVLAPVVVFLDRGDRGALVPVVQSVVMDAAGAAPVLASAAIQSGFNLANALGAALGGAVIGTGFGSAAPAAVGSALAPGEVALTVAAVLQARRAAGARHTGIQPVPASVAAGTAPPARR